MGSVKGSFLRWGEKCAESLIKYLFSYTKCPENTKKKKLNTFHKEGEQIKASFWRFF